MKDEIEKIVEPVIERHDCFLWGLEILRGRKRPTLRIYIESEQGANIDDCENISKDLNYEIDLELNHKFEVISNKGLINNPELLAMRTQQDINLASLNIQSNTFDSFSLTASYDKEPDQTVNRIGISIPLPIFNTKREETKIAFLEAKKNKLSIENRSFQIKQELIRLQKNRTSLKKQIKNNEKVLSLKNQLLEMYMEKYKISQATILELQRIKDSVIQTKKELIQTQLTLKQNAISQNYLQGNLNEKIIIN